MESPSSKLPALFENMRRLKQATLSFEALKVNTKHEPSLLNNQTAAGCDTGELSMKSGDTQLMEVVNLESNGSENGCCDENKTDAGPQKMCEAEIRDDNIYEGGSVKNNETEINNKQDVGPVLTEPPGKTKCNFNRLVNENNSDQENNLISNKRKLESNQPTKEQKPPKRAKLIYHVDKLKKCDDKMSGSKTEVKSLQSANADHSNNVDVKLNKENLKRNCKPIVLLDKLEDVGSLKRKYNTEYLIPCDGAKTEDVKVPRADTAKKDCVTPSSKRISLSSGKSSVKKLTPKQLERKAELVKRKEDLLQEKERKRKEKEKEKVRIKLEKEEFKRKRKEEREKKRQAEIEQKSEEKRKKEEKRRRKEEQRQEDKRRKEEQKMEDKRKREELIKKKEEEEELLKKKITKEAEAFSSFFTKYDVKIPHTKEESNSSAEIIFMPFTVKADMRLAPINRNPMDGERLTRFEKLYDAQSEVVTYLQELRTGAIVAEKRGNTWPLEEKYDEDLVILGLDLENEVTTVPKKKFSDRRPKLLQFYENRRPPYWGTWRKKSKIIRPRNPLGRDDVFEYDVDSDDEWEEEEPGESLHGSDDEKESEDEYEVDNDFFVPHGYLSDDENPEEEMISPETQKAKLKLLGEQFDMERNEKTKLLKPITLGCIWFNSPSDEPENVNPSVVQFLSKRKAVPWVDSIPIVLTTEENHDSNEVSAGDNDTPSSVKKATFPVAAVPDLIAFIHGSTNSSKNLAKAFLLHWTKKEESTMSQHEDNALTLSQARILKKIKELAKWEEFPEEGPCFGKRCWYVKRDVREKYGLANLVVNNRGDILEGKEVMDGLKKVSPSLITKFTKILTEDERRNQMTKSASRVKSVVTLNSSIEKGQTSPKSQIKPMKCVRKLRDFWVKPSISEKCSEQVSIPSESMKEDVVGASSPHEENLASC